ERIALMSIAHDVAVAANRSETVDEAILAMLRRLCDYNRWMLGHAYFLADDGRTMVSSDIWYVDEAFPMDAGNRARLEKFRQSSARMAFGADDDVTGRVFATGRIEIVPDLREAQDWRRSNPAEFGMLAVVAFPVRVGGRIVTVVECYADHPISESETF